MSTHRYPGGVISATPPTATSAGAVGVWTLEEALRNKAAGNWPDGSGADPYFRNTTLLLHGDGTNGAQNNTFLDSSTNNFTITRNGNTTQGSFDPYVGPGCWSDFYASTSSGWQTPASSVNSILGSAFNSTATFTAEAWIYPLSRHSGGGAVLGYVLGSMQLAGGSVDWSFGPDSNGNLVVFWYQGGNQICKGASVIPLNTWTHIAVSVSAGAIKLFVNGVQETTTGPSSITLSTQNVTYVSSGGYLYAGTTWQGFNGYISNLRVIGKRAVYTSTFTPSTTPLVATTDTTLLVNNSASLVDQSAGSWTLTATGGVQISKFSPFTLYQITPASYSGYFDGTGDYLSLSTSTAFGIGTGDFTIEYWAFYNSFASSPIGFDTRSTSGDTTPSDYVTTGGNLVFYSNSTNLLTSTNAAILGRWNHIAWVRSGTTLTSYINGVASGSVTSSANFGTTQPLRIAGNITAANFLNGSISNFRFVKGTAVYTTGFTPPIAPLTAISGTSLLTCQSTTFIDNSTNAFTITANGNARPRAANPFTDSVTGPIAYSTSGDGGSAYFDGTGDYLTAPASSSNIWPGSGSFTIEYWLYLPANPSTGYYTHFSYGTTGSVLRVFNTASTAKIEVFSGATTILNPAWPSAGQWNHFALVRNVTTLTLYINGAVAQSVTNSTDFSTGTLTVGGESASNPLLGYISNFRIVKGTAVYTAPFVPPTAPVTAVTNTQLLLNATNAGIFDNTTVNNLETVGAAQISTAVVKYGTGSISFNGTTSYLFTPNNNALDLGSGDFTLEGWVYLSANQSSKIIVSIGTLDGTTRSVGFWIGGTQKLEGYFSADGSTWGSYKIGTTTVVANQWNHVAFVRSGTTFYIFLNGISEGTQTGTPTTASSGKSLLIGGQSGNYFFSGYMDDIRITKGYARYTTNFTPPGSPFPNI